VWRAVRGALRRCTCYNEVREYDLGMSSVVKKRRKAITKHKLKKRRHRERFKAKH